MGAGERPEQGGTSSVLSQLVKAPREAGLGVTLRTAIGIPRAVTALDTAASGPPRLSTFPLALHRAEAEASSAAGRLSAILRDTITEEVAALQAPPRAA